MNLKKHTTVAGALAVATLALAGTAVGQDVHDRSAGISGQATIEYLDANDRATHVQPSSVGGALATYVDAAERSNPLTPRPVRIDSTDKSGFDWGSAAVGASSALVLALLIGVSLVTVRRFRTGPLAH